MRQEMMGFGDAMASARPQAYANNLHLAADRLGPTTPIPHHSIFTGRMLFQVFLTPNQQCQSTEGNYNTLQYLMKGLAALLANA